MQVQVLEEAVNKLVLRIDPSGADLEQATARAAKRIRDLCAELGAHDVSVRVDAAPPQINPISGKMRRICARRADASVSIRPPEV